MQPNGPTVYLVSCVSQKREQACAARDLYVSDLFCKARRFAEASGCPWFILSAEHGLVAPSQAIAPYERTLNTMRAADRRTWGERVAAELAEAVPDLSRVVFLAGKRYREFLSRHLASRGRGGVGPDGGAADRRAVELAGTALASARRVAQRPRRSLERMRAAHVSRQLEPRAARIAQFRRCESKEDEPFMVMKRFPGATGPGRRSRRGARLGGAPGRAGFRLSAGRPRWGW